MKISHRVAGDHLCNVCQTYTPKEIPLNINLKYSLFRCILIVYSHRGLVLNGYPNLKLFISIHWIYFATMIAYDFGVYPLSHMLKADFPHNSIKGQICMKLDFELGEKIIIFPGFVFAIFSMESVFLSNTFL